MGTMGGGREGVILSKLHYAGKLRTLKELHGGRCEDNSMHEDNPKDEKIDTMTETQLSPGRNENNVRG
jgi:hypothetical protein